MWIKPKDSPLVIMRIKCIGSRKLFMGWSKYLAPINTFFHQNGYQRCFTKATLYTKASNYNYIETFISMLMILFLWAPLLPCYDNLTLQWLISSRWVIRVKYNTYWACNFKEILKAYLLFKHSYQKCWWYAC